MNSWPVQQAIYAKLTSDTTLMAMITGVFDDVPRDQLFPYVGMGDMTETPNDALIQQSSQHTMTVHSWSRANGGKEVKQIMDRIDAVLHEQTLSLAGVVTCVREFAQSMQDSDGITRHGVQRFRVHATI